MGGIADTRLSPFLGARPDRRGDHAVVAVEKVLSGGTVVIQGGWANGLSAGTELRDPASSARLTITVLRGIAESEARIEPSSGTTRSGALLEVVAWAVPPGRPLHVWIPRSPHSMKDIAAIARSMADQAAQHGVRWIADPIDTTPSHLLRWGNDAWEMISGSGSVERVGQDKEAIAAVRRLAARSTLLVQLPAPAALMDSTSVDGVEQAANPEDADYVFVGRRAG